MAAYNWRGKYSKKPFIKSHSIYIFILYVHYRELDDLWGKNNLELNTVTLKTSGI